jgi:hypothetical protein
MAAGLQINDAGTWRPITAVSVNDVGTWRTILNIYVNDNGTWRLVFTALSATAAGTDPLLKAANANSIVSNNITATPSGGSGSYTYLWSIVTHDDPDSTPSINSASSVTCQVETADNPALQRTINVTVRCTVTDAVSGATAQTNTVTITHEHNDSV